MFWVGSIYLYALSMWKRTFTASLWLIWWFNSLVEFYMLSQIYYSHFSHTFLILHRSLPIKNAPCDHNIIRCFFFLRWTFVSWKQIVWTYQQCCRNRYDEIYIINIFGEEKHIKKNYSIYSSTCTLHDKARQIWEEKNQEISCLC